MAKGFKHGAGGGNPLNFAVVGGLEQPGNPKENMIWVNTDQKITSWIFSATEPAAPEEGMVWVVSGTASTVEFNALKKNGLQIYPISVRQYISGAWVVKSSQTYLGGQWKSWWDGTLYYKGDEYTAFTGGWTVSKGSKDSGSITVGSTSVASKFTATGTITKFVSFTGFQTLKVYITSASAGGSDSGVVTLNILNESGASVASKTIATNYSSLKNTWFSIDLSNLQSGVYKVRITAKHSSGSNQIAYGTFNEMRCV